MYPLFIPSRRLRLMSARDRDKLTGLSAQRWSCRHRDCWWSMPSRSAQRHCSLTPLPPPFPHPIALASASSRFYQNCQLWLYWATIQNSRLRFDHTRLLPVIPAMMAALVELVLLFVLILLSICTIRIDTRLWLTVDAALTFLFAACTVPFAVKSQQMQVRWQMTCMKVIALNSETCNPTDNFCLIAQSVTVSS